MKTIIKTLLILIVSISFFSCENNVEEETGTSGGIGGDGSGGGNGNKPCDPDISFVNNIQSIINSKCTGCHNGTVQLPDLRTYEAISINAQNIKSQVVSRAMPQGGSLTNEQIELIRCWVENGALNN